MMASKSQIELVRLAVLLVLVCPLAPPLAALAIPPGNCSNKCGDVTIPYPFGMSDGCYLDEDFLITCNTTSFHPPKPFLGTSNINVTSISLDGELHVLKYIGKNCPGDTSKDTEPTLTIVKFSINDTLNKFVVVGCDSYGYLEGEGFTTGCMSMCNKLEDVDSDTCNGVGCCKTSIPNNMFEADLEVGSFNGHENVSDFNPCTFAFLIEEKQFKFSPDNLTNLQFVEKLPLVLAWTIGNETCEEAKKNQTTYACTGNSTCYDMPEGYSGYRCSCLEGYEGNPYLPDGCQDINECEDEIRNECTFKNYCKNTAGSFTCSCPKGYSGEGRGKDGCKKNQNMEIAYVVIGVTASVVVLFVIISWLYLKWKREKFMEMRDRFYQDNGGSTLEQILSRQGNNTLNIYKEKEIIEATDNFNESNKLGEGGFGTVYRGMLRNVLVAVKKSKLSDSSEINHHNQIELFINELAVLSRINHINVVRLLGCCLESEIPMLVYEFIGNKTLSYHLHTNSTKGTSLPWYTRLTIATEAADVLSYLHSKASPPVLHRDIKPDNILLDESFTAKVADFGASTLIPLDQSQGHTLLVQATRGYLDPEFLQSGQLTEKSDVYSFGVVLAELLTRKRANFRDGAMQPRTLASYFLSEIEKGRWREIFDSSILGEANLEQLQDVVNLVQRCLSMDGDDRPTMRNVFHELENIKNTNSGAQAKMDSAEVSYSLENQPSANQSGEEIVQTQFWSANISSSSCVPT